MIPRTVITPELFAQLKEMNIQKEETEEKVQTPAEEQEETDELCVPNEDFFNTTASDYEAFNEKAWNKGDGYSAPNFPIFSEKMEGLESGLYMFAGESNHGKSAIALNLMYDFCTNPDNKLFGIYFSLDDTSQEIIPRLIAMNELIPISVASKPQRYQNIINTGDPCGIQYEEMLQKREHGLETLKELSKHFKVVDGTKIKCAEQILDYCIKAQRYVKAYDPEWDIMVCIDSLSDMRFASKHFRTDKELNDFIAKETKKWAVEILDIPIFGTLHLRKIDQRSRPGIDDVKESGEYVYEASALFLVYNDVSRNKQAASIYQVDDTTHEKIPVIELDWANNKKSSYKGRTYHTFMSNYSKVTECSKERMDRFNQLIYSA